MAPALRRIGVLTPMDIELAPFLRALALTADPDDAGVHVGVGPGGVEVVAVLTSIGMVPARGATERVLDLGVDHVMVSGIAGAVRSSLAIGTVIAPALVEDRAAGVQYAPTIGPEHCDGILSCGDDLLTDHATLDDLHARGVIALDMESAAVGAVCSAAGVPWSVHRAISDHAGGGLIDAGILAMAGPTGSGDPDARRRAFDDPALRARLEQLTRDSLAACDAAAHDAIATMQRLVG